MEHLLHAGNFTWVISFIFPTTLRRRYYVSSFIDEKNEVQMGKWLAWTTWQWWVETLKGRGLVCRQGLQRWPIAELGGNTSWGPPLLLPQKTNPSLTGQSEHGSQECPLSWKQPQGRNWVLSTLSPQGPEGGPGKLAESWAICLPQGNTAHVTGSGRTPSNLGLHPPKSSSAWPKGRCVCAPLSGLKAAPHTLAEREGVGLLTCSGHCSLSSSCHRKRLKREKNFL